MSEMVERVAKALAEKDGFEWESAYRDPHRSSWMGRARAAIAAMREPTEEMLSHADSAIPRAEADETGSRMMGREVALEAWQAMIDEALHPSSEG